MGGVRELLSGRKLESGKVDKNRRKRELKKTSDRVRRRKELKKGK